MIFPLKRVFPWFLIVLVLGLVTSCGSKVNAPSNLSYPQTNIVGTVGQAISPDTPTVTGTVTTWAVAPALPTGLSLNGTTGVISGTPTAVSAKATYYILASNSGGSSLATVQITINAAVSPPSNLSYPQTSIVDTVNQAISSDTPTVTGTVTTWAVAPALPSGLSLNGTTGVISGTPTAVSGQATYTITASNSAGSVQATVQITVNAALSPPSNLSYPQASIVGTVGQAISSDTPTVTGTVTTWAVVPALPSGLSLNSATGVISGTPGAVSSQTTYTITAGNSSGSTQTTVHITVNAASLNMNLSTFQAASVVIGQPNFTSNTYNQGINFGTQAYALGYPTGNPVVYNGVLYLPDRSNSRILGFNTVPTANDTSADFALGQPSVTSNGSGNTQTQMYQPQTVKVSGGKLFVLDRGNNRVLIWNSIPTSNGVAADVVVGQAGFGTSGNACSAANLLNAESIEVVNGKLIVSDDQNNRVLIWNSIPTTNGASANVVLGQGDFSHCMPNDDTQNNKGGGPPTARTLNQPSGLWSDGTRLIVADSYNNRVLIWDSIPTASFTPADLVLGQGNFTHDAGNDDNQDGVTDNNPSARTLSYPYMLDSDGTWLAVADAGNSRVLIWTTMPTTNFAPANLVLGQGAFTLNAANDDSQDGSSSGTPSAQSIWTPTGVYFYGTQLFVVDSNNNRCLIFDSH